MKREMMTTQNIIDMVKGFANGKNYLEIGIYRGHLLAEVGKVAKRATGIDDFSQFNDEKDNKEAVLSKIGENVRLIEGSCYDPNISSQVEKLDVIFYDAGHTKEETLKALEIYWPKLKTGGVFILDDWNHTPVYDAFHEFIVKKYVKYEVLVEKYTHKNASPDWWNGVFAFKKLPNGQTKKA